MTRHLVILALFLALVTTGAEAQYKHNSPYGRWAWDAASGPVDHYRVQFSLIGSDTPSDWIDWLNTPDATPSIAVTTLPIPDRDLRRLMRQDRWVYWIRVAAVDAAGAEGDWSKVSWLTVIPDMNINNLIFTP